MIVVNRFPADVLEVLEARLDLRLVALEALVQLRV